VTLRIVHVFPRSPFLSFTADVFEEAAPGANIFFGVGVPGEGPAYRVPAGASLTWIAPDARGEAIAAREIAVSDIVIMHSVGRFQARLLAAAPSSTLRVWSGWGGDYYGSNSSPMTNLLAPLTARYMRRRATLPGRIIRSVRTMRANKVLAPAARATDVFSAPIPDDLVVFRRRFSGFRGRYAQLNYASVEDTYAVGGGEVTGEDILVGNSANPSGNHLDALAALALSHSAGRRIIVPLSYGDAGYADVVVAEGVRLFGADFIPLRDFLPLDEYQALISRCSIVVMPHLRQQAIGNVASALWFGARAVLDARNPLANFLRRRGATFDLIQEGALERLPTGPVERAVRDDNRRVLEEFWGRSQVVDNARALVASIRR
jgi:hypothetical protein